MEKLEKMQRSSGRLNINIDVKRWCGTLTLAQKQMVLIARAVQNSCNFLILDEPTAPLSDTETEELFRVVKHLRETENIAIIFLHIVSRRSFESVILTQL